MRVVLTVIPFVALVSCGATLPMPPQKPALPPLSDDTCNANQYARLIGQDVTALEQVLLMGQVRVIRPGDAVTMDFRPNRINFEIDQGDTIASISCN